MSGQWQRRWDSLKLTMDWNCVLEVENAQAQTNDVQQLVGAHRKGLVELALLAVSATENTRERQFPKSAGLFRARIAVLGWEDLPILPMPALAGLSYFGSSYIVGDAQELETKRTALWSILAPNVAQSPRDHLTKGQKFDDKAIQSPQLARWRNTLCDVMSAYCHIVEGRDVFITNNISHFQKRAAALASQGMKKVMTPNEAARMVASLCRP